MNIEEIALSDKEILVVDDTIANLKILSDILTDAGYRVRPALDGAVALRSVLAKKPSLILLDIKMPGMDGYEVCRHLKAYESTRSIPIIFISILEDESDKVKGFEAGGVDYINKPFHPKEVLARVKTHLFLYIVQERLSAQNELLAREISERIMAQEALRKSRDELEMRVRERTADLKKANADLFEEIGKRKQAEDELKDEARRKDDFLAMLGHELRNPLAPIVFSMEIQKTVDPADPLAVQAREIIVRQVNYLTKIVDDLLDATRIAKGKIALRNEVLDLSELVRTVMKDFSQEAERRNILTRHLLPEYPVLVAGDRTRLAQVAGNLISNALKFTESGGCITVSVRIDSERKWGSLRVEDTGIGIAPETLSRLFKPFSQADMDLSRMRGGLGLGLALVKGLIELHNGKVLVASDGLGRGAAFTIMLPLVETSVSPCAGSGDCEGSALPEPDPPIISSNEHRTHAKTILIIEDNTDVAESTKLVLKIKGYVVDIAVDGTSGFRSIRERKPDIVLCDIGLPGVMDGFAVARAVRADPKLSSVFLIAMTGYGQEKDKARAINEGFDVHLTKPVNLCTLISIIESSHQQRIRS